MQPKEKRSSLKPHKQRQKVVHPNSRKATRLLKQAHHQDKVDKYVIIHIHCILKNMHLSCATFFPFVVVFLYRHCVGWLPLGFNRFIGCGDEAFEFYSVYASVHFVRIHVIYKFTKSWHVTTVSPVLLTMVSSS